MKKLLAILLSVLMLVGAMPLAVFAEMGGDFPWTDSGEKMLVEEVLERDGLIDGIWFPWFNAGETGHNLTGNDLMADYYNSSSSKNWDRVELDYYGADKIYREIYNLKAMGYNMLAYGGSIMAEGVIFDANGDVTGIKTEYLTNVRRLLDMCREIGMPVMWNVYFHCSSMPQYYGIDGWKVICSMLGNNAIADNYAENFVRPLCEVLAEYPDVVALVSIADEPENEINDIGSGEHYEGYRALYGVNQEDMVYFMQQINEVVREELPGVARTVASNSGNKTIYRDFDLDLMGHNQYTDGDTFKSVESLITDADPILTEYNIGSSASYTDDEYADKLITFREWMINNGYKGGFQWCWMTNSAGSGSKYFLQRSASDPTSFRKTVTLLKYYMDEYRAEYRGETLGLVAPVLYANDTSTTTLKFIPSEKATKITIQRSDDGGSTWKTLVSNVNQADYVDEYLVGIYTDSDTSRPSSGYCYRIVATDGTSTVTSEPNNVAGSDLAYKETYTAPTYTKGSYVGSGSVTSYMTQLTTFGVEANRPLNEAFNLIENGSFESTGGQWNTDSFLTYASVVSDSTTPLGEKSLYFNTSSVSTKKFYTFTVDGLEANTEYTFSAFLKGAYLADDNKGFGSVGVIDPYNSQFMVWKSAYPRASRLTQQLCPTAWDNEWHLRSVSFNTGDRTSYTIALYGYSSKMWVDGLALFESTNGGKYENGESAKAITTTTYSPASGATNAVSDPTISNSSYWNVGAGYKQGFMSIASGALKYTASSEPNGVRYTKWIDVKPGTDYYYSFTVKTTTAGGGRVAILDNSKELPHEVVTAALSSTGTKTYTGCISTGKHDQLGLCVVDLGGVATIDNVYLYEGGESVEIPTEPSYDGYIINGTFEIGSSSNWENLWNNNTVEMVTGRDSLFAMKGTALGQYTQVRQKITVEPNTDYVIEVWAKNVSNTTLLLKDSSDSNLKQTALLGSGSTWTKTTLEFNSGDNEFVYLGFMGGAAGATYTVDDVYMYKVAEPSYDGYVTNGDFEAGETGWTYNSGTHAIVTDSHGGNAALQLTNPGTWAEGAIQTFAVEPNTSYTITWWYKAATGTGTFNLFVMNGATFDNMTAEGGKAYMNNYTGDWQQGTYVVNSGAATTMMLKWSTEGSNPGTILIDDIVVVKTEDAECTHSYTASVTKQPTCGATGVRTYTCSLCGDSYTETIAATGSHTYDTFCDSACNVCGATRTVTHTYSGACDNYCNVCGAKKTGLSIGVSHTYDNACDADCNVCGETRSVSGHSYDNDCDATCNTCGTVRDAEHTYDNACDKDCNVCGATREVTDHDYVESVMASPTCGSEGMSKFTCSVCGDSYTKILPATGEHKYTNACDTSCNKCGAIREITHSYKGVVTAPDCVNGGYTTYTCTVCGDSYKDNYTEAIGHNYVGAETKAPTCTEAGVKTYTCSACGDSYTESIDALGHSAGAEADCENAQTCTVCGETLNAAIGHNYKGVVTAPDCENGGYTTYTCTACGDSYKGNYTEATGHNYVGTETKAPTCGTVGEMTYTCSACGDSYTEEIAATGAHEYFYPCDPVCMNCYEITNPDATHSVVHVEALEPTCTALGNVEYWYCSDCGSAWADEACTQMTNQMAVKLPMVDHEYFYPCDPVCMNCYEITNPDAAHTIIAVEAVEATCTENGNIAYWYCSDCGTAWADEALTQITNRFSVILPAAGHNYVGEVTTEATCSEVGEMAYTCTNCGDSYTEEIAATGAHEYNYACEKYCKNCGEKTNSSAKCSRIYHEAVAAVNCIEYGTKAYYQCEYCGVVSLDANGIRQTNLMSIRVAGDCISDAEHPCLDGNCVNCGLPVSAEADHTYSHDYDVDCDLCGTIREAEMPIAFGGNSVSEDVSGLAFRFDVTCEGMAVNGTTANYDNATVGGYKLIGMGAVVTNGVATTDISAVYLWELTDTTASYAVRVIKIPADKYDVEITATPYFIVEIDGVATTIYGEAQTNTFNQVAVQPVE